MPQVFNAQFDLHYRGDSGGTQGSANASHQMVGGSGRSLQFAIHHAVVQLDGNPPGPGTEIDVSFDLAPGRSVEIHGVVQSCDGDRVALCFPRFTAEVGQVLAAASQQRRPA